MKLFLLSLFICHQSLALETVNIVHKSNSQELSEVISKSLLKKRMVKLLSLMEEASSSSLEKLDSKATSTWALQSIEIGPGIHGQIGIGPWSVGAFAGFKLHFERN